MYVYLCICLDYDFKYKNINFVIIWVSKCLMVALELWWLSHMAFVRLKCTDYECLGCGVVCRIKLLIPSPICPVACSHIWVYVAEN